MSRGSRAIIFAAASIGAVTLLGACDALEDLLTRNRACAGVGWYGLDVQVRNEFGSPVARGAVVTLYKDGKIVETRRPGDWDSLHLEAAENRGGRFDVHVTKPFYEETVVRGVVGGGDEYCAPPPKVVVVPVTLALASGAPAVRGIDLFPPGVTLDRFPTRQVVTFKALVDANPGLSKAVTWSISGDDTASVFFDAATGTVTYRCREKSGFPIVTARSVADPTVSATVRVGVQGHPGAPNDPPC